METNRMLSGLCPKTGNRIADRNLQLISNRLTALMKKISPICSENSVLIHGANYNPE